MIINKTQYPAMGQIVNKTMGKWADQSITITDFDGTRIYLTWNGEKHMIVIWESIEINDNKSILDVSLYHCLTENSCEEVVSKRIAIFRPVTPKYRVGNKYYF